MPLLRPNTEPPLKSRFSGRFKSTAGRHISGRLPLRTASTVAGVLLAAAVLPSCNLGKDDEDDAEPIIEVLGFAEVSLNVGFDAAHEADTSDPLSVFAGGLAVADVDGDDLDDFLVLGAERGARLLIADGAGRFEERSSESGLELSGSLNSPRFADTDGDRDPDLLVLDMTTGLVRLFENDDGAFEERTDQAGFVAMGEPAIALAVDDVDGDQDLDVFVGSWIRRKGDAGELWLNDGDGNFELAAGAMSELSLLGYPAITSAEFSDLNRDDRPDLLITVAQGPNLVLFNTFDEAVRFEAQVLDAYDEAGALTSAIADVDGDGNFDALLGGLGSAQLQADGLGDAGLLDAAADPGAASPATDAGATKTSDASVSDAGASADAGRDAASDDFSLSFGAGAANGLLENLGKDGLIEWSIKSGIDTRRAWAGCAADFNNDSTTDIFQLVGGPEGEALPGPKMLLQRADIIGAFADATALLGGFTPGNGRAVICRDYDYDGDVDMFVFNHDGESHAYINLLNPELGPSNFVGVRLEGSRGEPNVVGARVLVAAGFSVRIQEIRSSHGGAGLGSAQLHFGVGAAEQVDEILVFWPDGAEETVLGSLPVNDVYSIRRAD